MKCLNPLNMLKSYRESLGARVFISVTIIVTIINVSFIALFIQHEKKEHTDRLVQKGQLLSEILSYNSRIGVFSENEALLRGPVSGIMQNDEVTAVFVFTRDGSQLVGQEKRQKRAHAPNAIISGQNLNSIIENLKGPKRIFYSESDIAVDFWAPVLSGQSRYGEETLFPGVKAAQKKEDIIGFVRVILDKAILHQELGALLVKNIFLGTLFLLLSLVVSYISVRNVIEPLSRLTRSVSVFGIGEPVEKVPVETFDEIGKLAAAFNDMVRSLTTREKEMIDLNINLKKEIEEKTALQREAARAAQLASLGELAAGVAHEINNPINSIINYAQLLIDESGIEGSEAEYAKRIMEEGDRIASIVKSLLSFARERKEGKTPVSIYNVISESLNLSGAQLRKDGIVLHVDVRPDLPEIIAHQYQIEQVFLNVISNARHALNQRYPHTHENKLLEVRGEKVIMNGSPHVRVTFYDHGAGIPADILEKVMSPFFTTKPAGMGTGLGLSISYGIIIDHNGTLNIESVEGEYTKVIIDLPAAEMQNADG